MQIFRAIFNNEDDDDAEDEAERARLAEELRVARNQAERSDDSDLRHPSWLFEPMHKHSFGQKNVYIFVVEKELWEQSAGMYSSNDGRKTVLLFDETLVEKYARVNYFSKRALPIIASSDPEKQQQQVQGYLRKDVELVYAYFYNQQKDEACAEDEDYIPDVRFESGSGTRLMRPFEKSRDLHAVFPLKLDAKTNKLVLPSRREVEAALLKCAKQYAINANEAHWRF